METTKIELLRKDELVNRACDYVNTYWHDYLESRDVFGNDDAFVIRKRMNWALVFWAFADLLEIEEGKFMDLCQDRRNLEKEADYYMRPHHDRR